MVEIENGGQMKEETKEKPKEIKPHEHKWEWNDAYECSYCLICGGWDR